MNIRFSAASKTFLVGEYAVLNAAPALLATTSPRFSLTASPGSGRRLGIPKGSPAALWCEAQAQVLKSWDLEFVDPHAGAGGFGASGAQFLFVHTLTRFLTSSVRSALSGLDLKALLYDYQALAVGSGSDLLAQAVGQVARVYQGVAEAQPWPFANLDFALVRSGHKLATHIHLEQLDVSRLRTLEPSATAAFENFQIGREEAFLSAISLFSQTLRDLNLVTNETFKLLEKVSHEPWCLASKGCGAMGADTIAVFFARENRDQVLNYFSPHSMVATSADLGAGLEMNWS